MALFDKKFLAIHLFSSTYPRWGGVASFSSSYWEIEKPPVGGVQEALDALLMSELL